MPRLLLVLLLVLLAPAAPVRAQGAPAAEGAAGPVRDPSPHSVARLVAPVTSIQPGQAVEAVLHLTMDEGWHVYWTNPGDAGAPPRLVWELPPGVQVEPPRFPFPERIVQPPLASYGYEREVYLFNSVFLPVDLPLGEVTLRAHVTWLVCADVCLPAEQDVALTLPVRADSPQADPTWDPPLALARTRLPSSGDLAWDVRAARTDDGYALTLAPPPGWAGDPAGLHFFPDSAGVTPPIAAQGVTRTDDGFRLAVPAPERSVPRARLSGVLVLADGSAWDGEGHRGLAVDVPVEGGGAGWAVAASGGGLSVWGALLSALAAGLLLNLMPCVFPVLSIKLLGFAQGREGEGADLRLHGLTFAAGVLVSFWALAGLLLALRAAGENLGWGYQLQSPLFVGGLVVFLFLMGLNLAGLFEVGFGLAGVGGRLDRKTGLGGAFLSGVLATVVATPCTVPIVGMASALTYALTETPAIALLVFTALGVGMALPYVLLASFPRWLERLPRPGPWMATLKQALAFPLFATTAWLLWVFGGLTGVDGLGLLLLALVLAALAGWLVGRWDRLRISRGQHLLTRTLALVAAGLALYAGVQGARQEPPAADVAAGEAGWQRWSPADVAAVVAEGRPAFVDFTAGWCITCQQNKLVALHRPAVERAFRERGVATFRADWTRRDPEIAEALASFGRAGVPLYVLYPGGGAEPVLLPELLTQGIVLDALERVRPPVAAR